IANSDIAGGCELIACRSDLSITCQGKATLPGISQEQGQKWVSKVGMVENIEELRAQLELYPLADRRALIQREIPLLERWPMKRIAPQVAKVAGSGNAIRSYTVCTQGWIDGARDGERAEFDEIAGIALMVAHPAAHVGT